MKKKAKRLVPGGITYGLRCVVCREKRPGIVAHPLPGRSAKSKDCICRPCVERAAEWVRIWRKHIAHEKRTGGLDMVSPSLPTKRLA